MNLRVCRVKSLTEPEELSQEYDVSRERIRQIEVRAFEKLQKKMRELAADRGLVPAVN